MRVAVASAAPACCPRLDPRPRRLSEALDDLVTRPMMGTKRASEEPVGAGAVSKACAIAILAVVAGCSSGSGAAQTATAASANASASASASADARVGTEAVEGSRREQVR